MVMLARGFSEPGTLPSNRRLKVFCRWPARLHVGDVLFAGIRQDVAPRPMQALNFDLPFCRKSKVDVLLGEEQESCTLQNGGVL